VTVDLYVRDLYGQKAVLLLPTIPDDAPDEIREGIARRRIVMTTGTCPCGGEMVGPNRAQRRRMERDKRNGDPGVWQVRIEHDDDCPALDATLYAAIRRWRS
jgi:hypothetical protein